jgi:hypothetical protein
MNISELFTDQSLVAKIQKRLPVLFYLAELESSRAGKVGMEVGRLERRSLSHYFSINSVSKMSKLICQSMNLRLM